MNGLIVTVDWHRALLVAALAYIPLGVLFTLAADLGIFIADRTTALLVAAVRWLRAPTLGIPGFLPPPPRPAPPEPDDTPQLTTYAGPIARVVEAGNRLVTRGQIQRGDQQP